MFKASPHERITSLLSRYLEFDPEQLRVGIWSGNLQIGGGTSQGGILLRPEAISSLLAPYNLTLLSGGVESLHVKIPWKNLLDGQSKVEVHVSGLFLVVGFRAKPFTLPLKLRSKQNLVNKEQNMDEVLRELLEQGGEKTPSTLLEREVKQNLIRQAEKKLYSSKNPTALQQVIDEHRSKSERLRSNHFKSWVDAATSSILWKLISSIHLKLENCRVAFSQDHLKIGLSLDFFQVVNTSRGHEHHNPDSNTPPDEKVAQFDKSTKSTGNIVINSYLTDFMRQASTNSVVGEHSRSSAISDRGHQDTGLQKVTSNNLTSSLNPEEGTLPHSSMEKLLEARGIKIYITDDSFLGRHFDDLSQFSPHSRSYHNVNTSPNDDTIILERVQCRVSLIRRVTKALTQGSCDSITDTYTKTQIQVNASTDGITGSLSSCKYRHLYYFAAAVEKTLNGRPQVNVLRDSRDPGHLCTVNPATGEVMYSPRRSIRLWWHYALCCIIQRNRAMKKGRQHASHQSPLETKIRVIYMDLFSSIYLSLHARVCKLQGAQDCLLRLEDILSVEQIIIYRTLARHAYRRYKRLNQSHFQHYQVRTECERIPIEKQFFNQNICDSILSNEQLFDAFAARLSHEIESLDQRLRESPDGRLLGKEPMYIYFSLVCVISSVKFSLFESFSDKMERVFAIALDQINFTIDGDTEKSQNLTFSVASCHVDGHNALPFLDNHLTLKQMQSNDLKNEDEILSSNDPNQDPIFSGELKFEAPTDDYYLSLRDTNAQSLSGRLVLIANLGRLPLTLDTDNIQNLAMFFRPIENDCLKVYPFIKQRQDDGNSASRQWMFYPTNSKIKPYNTRRRYDVEFVFQGFDIRIPLRPQEYGLIENVEPQSFLQLSCGWAEIRSGSFLQQQAAFMHWNWHHDDSQLPLHEYTTEPMVTVGDETREKHNPTQHKTTIGDCISKHFDPAFVHYHLTTNGIHLNLVENHLSQKSFDILRQPLSASVILSPSVSSTPGLENQSSLTIVASVSPIYLHITDHGLEHVLCLLNYNLSISTTAENASRYANCIGSSVDKEMNSFPYLHCIVICELMYLSLESSETKRLMKYEKEIMLEECLKDLVSHVACTKSSSISEAESCSRSLCLDRIVALGLSHDVAHYCVEQVTLAFLEDVELIDQAIDLEHSEKQPITRFSFSQTDSIENTEKEDGSLRETSDMKSIRDGNGIVEQIAENALDELQLAMQNAVERVVSTVFQFVYLSGSTEPQNVLILSVHDFKAQVLQLVKEKTLFIDFSEICVRNELGFSFMKINCKKPSRWDSYDFDIDKAAAVVKMSQNNNINISDTCDHGGSFRISKMNYGITIHTELVEIRLMPKMVEKALELLLSFLAVMKRTMSRENDTDSKSVFEADGNNLSVEFLTFSVVLLSNELNPFLRFQLRNFSISQREMSLGDYYRRIELSSEELRLLDLSAQGHGHPEILYPVKTTRSTNSKSVQVRVFLARNQLLCPHLFNVHVEKYNLIVLKRWVDELSNYFFDPDQLFGSICFGSAVSNENNRAAYPMALNVEFLDSQILLPRNSNSYDIIAVSFNRLEIKKSLAERTWVSEKEYNFVESCENPENDSSSSKTVFDEDEFFDCLEEDGNSSVNCSFDPKLIERWNMDFIGARLFTALDSKKDRLTKKDAFAFVRSVHLASPGAFVYVSFDGETGMNRKHEYSAVDLKELLEIRWNEITDQGFNLRVTADYAPTLRILVDNSVDEWSSMATPDTIRITMLMSELYLFFSIWYDNMQELPTLFPYSANKIIELATKREIPSDYPEVPGSQRWTEYVKSLTSVPTFEFCVKLIQFKFTSISDPEVFEKMKEASGSAQARDCVSIDMVFPCFRVMITDDAMLRCSLGICCLEVVDHRRDVTVFPFAVKSDPQVNKYDLINSCTDFNWGLGFGRHSIGSRFPLPVQASVFITPDKFCLVNLGFDSTHFIMENLDAFWILTDYFGNYFRDALQGNPFFRSDALKRKRSKKLGKHSMVDAESLNLDVRIWCTKSEFAIPSDASKASEPCLIIGGDQGFFYRYQWSIPGLTCHEFCCKDASLRFQNVLSARDKNFYSENSSSLLCSGLRLFARYSFDEETRKSDLHVSVPIDEKDLDDSKQFDGLECPSLISSQLSIPPIAVVGPQISPNSHLGPYICNFIITHELPRCLQSIKKFIGVIDSDINQNSTRENSITNDMSEFDEQSYTLSLCGVRFILCDPVLGTHYPISALCIPALSLQSTVSSRKREIGEANRILAGCSLEFWIDYFNGTLKMWEPFVEPYKTFLLYENCTTKGNGLVLRSNCNLHLNLSLALFETLEQVLPAFRVSSYSRDRYDAGCVSRDGSSVTNIDEFGPIVQSFQIGTDKRIIKHFKPSILCDGDRVAFSLLNLTGQQVRFHTHVSSILNQKDTEIYVSYLKHGKGVDLTFEATYCVLENLNVKEIPFEVFLSKSKSESSFSKHNLGVQILGFRWNEKLPIDKLGRHFDGLCPLSSVAKAQVKQDWKIQNALTLVTEISLSNGGRQICLMSPFKIVNKSTHAIRICLHPDRGVHPNNCHDAVLSAPHSDNPIIEEVHPNETYHIPFNLVEAAVEMTGNQLGSIWIAPNKTCVDTKKALIALADSHDPPLDTDGAEVGFSSTSIDLKNLVRETVAIHEKNSRNGINSDNPKSTALTISCPIHFGSRGMSHPPFCYAVEVRRSQIKAVNYATSSDESVISKLGKRGKRRLETLGEIGKTLKTFQEKDTPSDPRQKIEEEKLLKKFGGKEKLHESSNTGLKHEPVLYSLVVHPPFVIENLLPERGTFELLHATRKQIVWSGFLEAGERVPIYSVGLDAPLFLLMNLGYCRTPNGEGALVHDGKFSSVSMKDVESVQQRFNIGQAVQAVERMTALPEISESSEDRARRRIAQAKEAVRRVEDVMMQEIGQENGFYVPQIGGSLDLEDDFSFIATETALVDSLGNHLRLGLENRKGGAGERRISVYCPYWILNTTEHALRYRQEGSSSFVCGTIFSPKQDGSKPVDGRHRNYIIPKTPCMTIFSGAPGALARANTSEQVKSFAGDEELPLEQKAAYSFMFNFHDSGRMKLCLQLAQTNDGSRSSSNWSRGFTIDSIGVTQVVGIHCMDGRALEVAVTVNVPSGRLSSFTKIVQLKSRYILVNELERPIRMWQDSSVLNSTLIFSGENSGPRSVTNSLKARTAAPYDSLFGKPGGFNDSEAGISQTTYAHRSALYVASAKPHQWVPFYLPDSRGERHIRFDLGGEWNLTSSIPADSSGQYTLKICRSMYGSTLRHLSTREHPEYNVVLPPEPSLDWDGELGVWFEAMSEKTGILVKGTRKGKYSYYSDIQEGDELIAIDGYKLENTSFEDTIKILKHKLSILPKSQRRNSQSFTKKNAGRYSFDKTLVLTFRSYEERMRRERNHKSRENDSESTRFREMKFKSCPPTFSTSQANHVSSFTESALEVSMNVLKQSIYVHVKPFDFKNPPYFIENRSPNRTVYFRQRGCDGHPWSVLAPGSRCCYMWEEPLKPKKLSVRVGPESVISSNANVPNVRLSVPPNSVGNNIARAKKVRTRAENEENGIFGPNRSIKLEEIGFADVLPCPVLNGSPSQNLFCRIDTKGETRVLIISDSQNSVDEIRSILDHICILEKSIQTEATICSRLNNIRSFLTDRARNHSRNESLERSSNLKVEGKSVNLRSEGLKSSSANDLFRAQRTRLPSDETAIASVNSRGTAIFSEEYMDSESSNAILNELHDLVDDDSEQVISKPNQLYIEVIEASGLKSADISGSANPYCEIKLKLRGSTKKLFSSESTHKTYYCEKTLNPRWTDQKYTFDVPSEAANFARGYAIVVKLRSFEILRKDSLLGRADIQLHALRNQRQLTGWYPLKGNHQSTNDRVLGSIKLRLQWIWTVHALVDYWALISETRLAFLKENKHRMDKQLESIRKQQKSRRPSNIILPARPALGKARRSKSIGLKNIQEKKLVDRQLPKWRINLKQSNSEDQHATRRSVLYSLHSQTLESKRRRTLFNNKESAMVMHSDESNADAKMTEIMSFDEFASSSPSYSELPLPVLGPAQSFGEVRNLEASDMSVDSLRKVHTESNGDDRWKLSDMSSDARKTFKDMPFGPMCSPSQFSLTANPQMPSVPMVSPDGDFSVKQNVVEDFLVYCPSQGSNEGQERPRFFSTWETLDDIRQIPLDLREIDEKILRMEDLVLSHDKTANDLYGRGLLYHGADWSHHRRTVLLSSSWIFSRCEKPDLFPSDVRDLTSWNDAVSLLNDPEIAKLLKSESLNLDRSRSIKQSSDPSNVTSDNRNEQHITQSKYRPSQCQPIDCSYRRKRDMMVLDVSRNLKLFASRSKKMVLNQGGWLTIRPITALNLPELTTMAVKLKYGEIVQVSRSVDARVCPTWTEEAQVLDTTSARHRNDRSTGESIKNQVFSKNIFRYRDNDLQVFVEHMKTSGTLRLSVVGEKFNSEIEVGVLFLPINAALSCCNDMICRNMDETRANVAEVDAVSSSMYVRWFPLKSSKECVSAEGDMGTSFVSNESEKESDETFTRFHTPCIKLALLWEPDSFEEEWTSSNVATKAELEANSPELTNRARIESTIRGYHYAEIAGITASLIDSFRSLELFSISLEQIDVKHFLTETKAHLKATLGWLQIDHQSLSAREPVVLAPRPVSQPQPTLQIIAVKDNARSKASINTFEYVAIALQEMDLRVEESWLFECWMVFLNFIRNREVLKSTLLSTDLTREDVASTGSGNVFQAYDSMRMSSSIKKEEPNRSQSEWYKILSIQKGASKFYVETFMIGNLKINISYIKSISATTVFEELESNEATNETPQEPRSSLLESQVQTLHEKKKKRTTEIGFIAFNRSAEIFRRWSEQDEDDDFWTQGGGKYAHRLPDIISPFFPSIADAPIKIPGKIMEHVFESLPEILASLKDYYAGNTLRQIYRIVGSLELLGNPRDAFSQIATGVKDFFYEPSRAFLLDPKNPTRLGIGVAKGTLSLVSHSASGFFGFASRMSSTAGHAAATLSLDKKYLRRRDKFVSSLSKSGERNKGKSEKILEALKRPLQDLIFGFGGAAIGIVVEPYRGCKKNGTLGFTKGFAIGIVGVVTKPLVGIFDALAHTAESISMFAERVNVLDKKYDPVLKRRMAHSFGISGVLLPFDLKIAYSMYLLHHFPLVAKPDRQSSRDRWSSEVIITTETLNKGSGFEIYIIVTNARILTIKLKREGNGKQDPVIMWQILLNKIHQVKSRIENRGHNGVVLHLKETLSMNTSKKGAMSSEFGSSLSFLSPKLGWSTTDGAATSSPTLSRWQTSAEGKGIFNQPPRRVDKQKESYNYRLVGEYHQKSPIVRVHNAICCLVGDFESIIRENGLGPEGTDEGMTCFGILSFSSQSVTNCESQWRRNRPISALDATFWAFKETEDKTNSPQLSTPNWQNQTMARYLGYMRDCMSQDETESKQENLFSEETSDPDWLWFNEATNESSSGLNAPIAITPEESTLLGTTKDQLTGLRIPVTNFKAMHGSDTSKIGYSKRNNLNVCIPTVSAHGLCRSRSELVLSQLDRSSRVVSETAESFLRTPVLEAPQAEGASPAVSTMGFDEGTISTRLSKVESLLEDLVRNQKELMFYLARSNLRDLSETSNLQISNDALAAPFISGNKISKQPIQESEIANCDQLIISEEKQAVPDTV